MDIKEIEKHIQDFWKEHDTYQKVKKHRIGGKPFYFCDGPPYATGEIHPGTAWNKVMKDAYCRYYRMNGYNVRDQAGFDTHGLPIEVKVEKKLGIKEKSEIENKIGVKNFIDECKLFATKYIGVMSDQFKSVGVWLDFDAPYLTYQNSFIEKSWSTIKKAHERGILKEELYVVPFCPRCETTSANYELEYHDKTDTSILVKFKVRGADNKYLVIWTTTPWTLPANVAVMAHPNEEYVEAKVGNEIWIFAKARLEYIQERVNEDMTIVNYFSGLKLNGLEYEHPLLDYLPLQQGVKHKVVMSDRFVTMEDGSGLVHTAPGHGPEDFIVGKENGLDILCPVDQRGHFTSEAGKYQGYYVFDANKTVVEDLDERNMLIHQEALTHRYAHCWRCKTPLIYLATKQWFIKVSELKDKMAKEIEATYWRPKFAKEQFKTFVSEAPDWCISRQRYWGIPLPIWRCNCGEVKVIGSAKELPTKLEDFHRPEIDNVTLTCTKCGGTMHRVKDVLDVWFDSGNVVWASLREGEDYKQADLILEGKDQIRGWFYSLLGSSAVNIGMSPYKAVMMHGYFTDEKGEKMSKSVGNFVPLEAILEKTSVDTFRYWGMQNVPWDDIRFNWDELNDVKRFLIIYTNLIAYMQRFYEKPHHPDKLVLENEDKWLLLRLNEVVQESSEGFNSLELHRAARAVKSFIVDDLSRFYMKLAKRRVSEGINPEAVHYVLYKSMLTISKLMAPLAPHMSEYAYQEFFRKHEGEESIHLLDWPETEELEYEPVLVDEFKVVDEIVGVAGALRNEAQIKARWPLASITVVTKDALVERAVYKLSGVIESLANVRKTRLVADESAVDYGKFAKGTVREGVVLYVDTNVTEDLYREGMKNEFVRRVQAMRKEKGLVESDRIDVIYDANDEIAEIIEVYLEEVAKKVNAFKIKKESMQNGTEWRIGGNTVKIEIIKL